jgi:sporulation protein YlmC with PRC-barrel domain
MRLELGTPVRCSDGDFGELADLVVDPRARLVTHLVVRSGRMARTSRLVPLDLAEVEGHAVRLACTVKEARALPTAEGFACVSPGEVEIEDHGWDIGIEHVLVPPSYPDGELGGFNAGAFDETISVVYDRIPKGEVEIRRKSTVVSSDDKVVGRIDGVVVDSDNGITHVVVERGRLWRRRNVTIPMSSVTRVETDAVIVDLTRDQVRGLRAVGARRSDA